MLAAREAAAFFCLKSHQDVFVVARMKIKHMWDDMWDYINFLSSMFEHLHANTKIGQDKETRTECILNYEVALWWSGV